MSDQPAAADAADIFESWLESGSTRTVNVVIYNDPAIEADIEELERRRQELEDAPQERTLDQPNALAQLERDEEALLARLEASKSTWSLKALLDSEFDAALEQFPDPEAPQMLPKSAPEKAKERWARDRDAYVKGAAAQEVERRLLLISKAVTRVETVAGTATSVTVDQLRAMLEKEYGSYRINLLWTGLQDARRGDVKLPAPK